jgi:hypothetical protein
MQPPGRDVVALLVMCVWPHHQILLHARRTECEIPNQRNDNKSAVRYVNYQAMFTQLAAQRSSKGILGTDWERCNKWRHILQGSWKQTGNMRAVIEFLMFKTIKPISYNFYRIHHKSSSQQYCTVLAVLVRNNRLSHLVVHTFYSPTTVGVTVTLLHTQELSNSRRLSFLEASWSLAA